MNPPNNDSAPSLGTRRFRAFCLALGALVALGAGAMAGGVPPSAYEAYAWPVLGLAGLYLGAGMAHDAVVRRAAALTGGDQ